MIRSSGLSVRFGLCFGGGAQTGACVSCNLLYRRREGERIDGGNEAQRQQQVQQEQWQRQRRPAGGVLVVAGLGWGWPQRVFGRWLRVAVFAEHRRGRRGGTRDNLNPS